MCYSTNGDHRLAKNIAEIRLRPWRNIVKPFQTFYKSQDDVAQGFG